MGVPVRLRAGVPNFNIMSSNYHLDWQQRCECEVLVYTIGADLEFVKTWNFNFSVEELKEMQSAYTDSECIFWMSEKYRLIKNKKSLLHRDVAE